MTQIPVSGWVCLLQACLSVPMSPFPQTSAPPVSTRNKSRAGAGQRCRYGRWTRALWLSHPSHPHTSSIAISGNWAEFWASTSKAGCSTEDLDFWCTLPFGRRSINGVHLVTTCIALFTLMFVCCCFLSIRFFLVGYSNHSLVVLSIACW